MEHSSSKDSLDAESVIILERREANAEGVLLFTAHWHIFVPSLLIAMLSALIVAALVLSGQDKLYFARLFFVSAAVAVPVLIAWAFLRFQTICLQINDGKVSFHSGWPKSEPDAVLLDDVIAVNARIGTLAKTFGGGDLELQTEHGMTVIRDLAQPQQAADAIRLHLKA